MCVLYMVYTGCNKGGVTVSDAAALLPWSSPRRPDFLLKVQLGTSVLLTTADFHRLIPCPVWLCRFCGHHVTLHILFCCVWSSTWIASHWYDLSLYDLSEKMNPSYNLYKKKRTIKQNKHTNQQVIEKMWGGGLEHICQLFCHTSLHCLSRAMRLKHWCQPGAPYTPLPSTETTELFITLSRVKDHAWLVDVYMAAWK